MPTYTIIAKRETYYDIPITANTEAEAIEEMNRREISEDIEEYAYDWFPLEIVEIEVDEVE
jgi:hypothetical protein